MVKVKEKNIRDLKLNYIYHKKKLIMRRYTLSCIICLCVTFKKQLLIAISFVLPLAISAQEVIIRKNANNDPWIELKSVSFNTFVGDSSGFVTNNAGTHNTTIGFQTLR